VENGERICLAPGVEPVTIRMGSGRHRFYATVVFELCRRTLRPSLTFRLVGGSTFGLWPLFHLRDGGKWGEMDCLTAWGNFKTLISALHHNKNYAWFFSLTFKKKIVVIFFFLI
jgi:hypothetical protein